MIIKNLLLVLLFTSLVFSNQVHALGKKKTTTPPGDTPSPYTPVVENFRWVIPGNGLPVISKPSMASNNNVAIFMFHNRLYMAWRNAPSHFASPSTEMHVVSSGDMGKTWNFEKNIHTGKDLREPFFYEMNDKLFLIYAELGTNPVSFDPHCIWRTVLTLNQRGGYSWTPDQVWIDHPEMPWEIKKRNGLLWMTSYTGNHYKTGTSDLLVHFRKSSNGYDWDDMRSDRNFVYVGGVSEVGFEFDKDGTLWGVTRNEDGDATGFGSQVVSAAGPRYDEWQFPGKSNPNRYDSSRMFRHGDDIYLIARRDIGGPYDMGLDVPDEIKKITYLVSYSFRPKRSALYRIDRTTSQVVHLFDLPGDGDTAFPSIVQLDDDRFLIANYTSPLAYPNRDWFSGQTSPQGTQIYFIDLVFKPKNL